jgi:cobalamin biosynthesis protein CbiM
MQALLFADGGLTALGLNVFNMSLVGVWVGYAIFILVKKLLPKNKSSVSIAAFLAGLISVPFAATGFVLQYAIGGTATFSISQVLTAMLGTHFLIGIGEGVITALAVGAVMASRSDLVYGYKGTTQTLETRVKE